MDKFRFKTLALLIVFLIFSPSGVAFAQATPLSNPVYIVQEGDSLWEIAYRFHVTQEELAWANGIVNADQISIGMPLIIPGLEGIQGILTTRPVEYGENLQSLSLLYNLSPKMLRQLNHITSPDELYAGYSLIVPQNDTAMDLGKRTSLSTGQSLIELSVAGNTNPWEIILGNNKNDSWSVLPGEVLRAPGKEDSGPGALPPYISSVDTAGLIQGETAVIQVVGDTDFPLSGSLFEHSLSFIPGSDQKQTALQGVHAMAKPGLYPLTLIINPQITPENKYSQMVLVQAGDFPYDRSLPVDPATLDPETNRKENELWSSLSTPVGIEKFWRGKFFLPVDPVFGECYSSKFGNRRSYNGGEYLYFHTGLDFCGQVGDPIYAAAPGTVVFANS